MEVLLHLFVLCVPLCCRGIGMLTAKESVLLHERDIRLRQGAVEGTILQSDNVIRDKSALLHVADHICAFRTIFKEFEEGDFQHDELALLEDLLGTLEYIKLSSLHVQFKKKRS